MMIDRRRLLGLSAIAAASAAYGQAAREHGWYKLRADNGQPFPNMRIPVEIGSEVDRLPAMIRAGSDTPDVTLIEFYDYNCPYCRKASQEIAALAAKDPDLRLGLVNNPILSPGSKEAARVEVAVTKLLGRKAAFALHQALFAAPGRIDGARALAAAKDLGFDERALGEAAANDPEVRLALEKQMDLAAALALSVTPSFVIGGAGVIGYPGPKTMANMIASVRKCELIACN